MLHQVLVQHFPSSAPLRVQGPPSASRLNNLVKWCEMYGIDAGAGESLSLQRIIDASQQPGASSKLLIAKTRCALVLGPARYACAGRLSEKARRHFSLNLDCFTQFSSPIRRYLDIVVHRMLLEAVTRTSNSASPGSTPGLGGSGHSSLTPDFMLQLCEASDKTAARARAVQNLSWDLCLAAHLNRTPRLLPALITQVSPVYIKIYVPQLAYLPDHLRRIPIRVLCPSSVTSQENDTVIVLSWGTKDRSVGDGGHDSTSAGACSSGSSGSGGGGGAAGNVAVGGYWVLGPSKGSISRLDGSGDSSAGAGGEGQIGAEGRDQGLNSVLGARTERHSIRVFDWVRVQFVGHVDARGVAGPKLEALILGDFAIPFDHRANPQQRLLVNSPPLAAGRARGGRQGQCGGNGGPGTHGDHAASTAAAKDATSGMHPAPTTSDWPTPKPHVHTAACDAAGTHVGDGGGRGASPGKAPVAHVQMRETRAMEQLAGMIEGMRHVIARHVASAAAALPADATVRLNGVEITGHALDPESADDDSDWCMACFAIPVDAVAALASSAAPGPVSSQEQHQQQVLAALCGGPVRPGILQGLLCSIYLECPALQRVMRDSHPTDDAQAAPVSAAAAQPLPSISPPSSGPSPLSSGPSSSNLSFSLSQPASGASGAASLASVAPVADASSPAAASASASAAAAATVPEVAREVLANGGEAAGERERDSEASSSEAEGGQERGAGTSVSAVDQGRETGEAGEGVGREETVLGVTELQRALELLEVDANPQVRAHMQTRTHGRALARARAHTHTHTYAHLHTCSIWCEFPRLPVCTGTHAHTLMIYHECSTGHTIVY